MSFFTSLRVFRTQYRFPSTSLPCHSVRCASLNSAIGRGIRKSRIVDDHSSPRETWRSRGNRNRSNRDSTVFKHKELDEAWDEEGFDEDEFIKTGNFRALPREHQRFRNNQKASKSYPKREDTYLDVTEDPASKQRPSKQSHHRYTDRTPERVKSNVSVPESMPFTTPASQFLYGTSAVEAALRCGRRQIYKLYLYQAADEQLSPAKVALRKLALSKGVPVKMAFAGWNRLFDKVSMGRAHNGCVLETSPLPRLPVKSLLQASPAEDHFSVELAAQSREEAVVNGTNNRITINHSHLRRRYPVVVLLDGVVDPGNLGAIVRSAYYLGVDAIVFAGRNSAPLSATAIKSSAGAAENMTLLQVSNEVDFIRRSKAVGWRFYAADAPSSTSRYVDPSPATDSQGSERPKGIIGDAPSVIMLGSEGDGLSSHIRSHADATVSIPGSRLGGAIGLESDPARVDSLNVSVAAALLMEMFLRVPLALADAPPKRHSR
ncbi:Alpha/beta knot methyltransferase [Aspergillus ambiguus]|uniref:RNA methyltransferase n=1 Tax=Aspergillus ambiguus TaxID=176160 RepID=UPI003CCD5711